MVQRYTYSGGYPKAIESRYQSDPRLALALGGVQAGSSMAPVQSPLEGIARALQGVVGGYTQNRIKKDYDQQADDYRKRIAEALVGDRAGLASRLTAIDPDMGLQLAVSEATAKPDLTFTDMTDEQEADRGLDTSGVYQLGSDNSVKTVQEPAKPEATPDAIRQYNFSVSQGYKGTFDNWKLDQARAGASVTNVTVDAGDKQQDKTLGTFFGGELGDILKAGANAPKTIGKYDQLKALTDQVSTGKFAGTMLEVKKALTAIGIDPTILGLADDADPAQAAQALGNVMALELRNPSGGAGMPGAMSDHDRVFLQNAIAGIEKTPGANALMFDYAKRLARRDIEVARLARKYAQAHGGLIDFGFYDELDAWSQANPLFTEEDAANIRSLGTTPPPDLNPGGQAPPLPGGRPPPGMGAPVPVPVAGGGAPPLGAAVNYRWLNGALVPQ